MKEKEEKHWQKRVCVNLNRRKEKGDSTYHGTTD